MVGTLRAASENDKQNGRCTQRPYIAERQEANLFELPSVLNLLHPYKSCVPFSTSNRSSPNFFPL